MPTSRLTQIPGDLASCLGKRRNLILWLILKTFRSTQKIKDSATCLYLQRKDVHTCFYTPLLLMIARSTVPKVQNSLTRMGKTLVATRLPNGNAREASFASCTFTTRWCQRDTDDLLKRFKKYVFLNFYCKTHFYKYGGSCRNKKN